MVRQQKILVAAYRLESYFNTNFENKFYFVMMSYLDSSNHIFKFSSNHTAILTEFFTINVFYRHFNRNKTEYEILTRKVQCRPHNEQSYFFEITIGVELKSTCWNSVRSILPAKQVAWDSLE